MKIKKITIIASTIAPLSALSVLACNATKVNLTDNVVPSDFEFSGINNEATIKIRESKFLDSRLEIKYFVGSKAPANDNQYIDGPPRNLKKGDQVFIKVFLKKIFENVFDYSFTPFNLIVPTLPTILLEDSISSTDFTTEGYIGTATLKLGKTLSQQLEVRYWSSSDGFKPLNDAQYTTTIPQNLKNGFVVFAKLFVKPEFQTTYAINARVIQMAVSGLEANPNQT